MEPITATLGEQIQLFRRRANLTQKELAEQLQISQTIISQVETGQRELDHSEIHIYATALNIHPLILLNTIPNNGCRAGKVRNKHRG
jgi:transcriptional regulator with XRE-family HTH domain